MTLAGSTEHRRRWAAVAGGTLWAAWIVSVVAGPGPFDLAGQIVGTDWIQFHAAGVTVLGEQGARLYDIEWQHRLQEVLLGSQFDQLHVFLNPPLYAGLLVPFGTLAYPWSFACWAGLQLLFLAVSFRLLGRMAWSPALAYSLAFFPVFAAITFGQNGLLSLAIMSGVWFLWSRKRPFAAGFCASLLWYKPHLLLGLVVLWLLRPRRDGRALASLAVGGVVAASLSFVLFPAGSQEYLHLVQEGFPSLMRIEGFPIWHAHHLRAFWHLLFPGAGSLAEALWLLSTGVFLGGFAWLVRGRVEDRRVLFSAMIVLTLLVTPHAMIYDWVLLLLPFFLIGRCDRRKPRTWVYVTAAVWTVLFVAGPLTALQLRHAGRAIQLSVPVLALAAWLVFPLPHSSTR